MQAVNNESRFSQAATYAAFALASVPKKYVVGVLATSAGIAGWAVTRKDALLTQTVTTLASAAISGYGAHRLHDLAQLRVFQKLIAPAFNQFAQELGNLIKALESGDLAALEKAVQDPEWESKLENEPASSEPSSFERTTLPSNGIVPASVQTQLAYQNNDSVKQSMIRLVAARAYVNSLSSNEERKAVATQLMAQVFDGVTTQSTALELLGTEKGTSANKSRLEDLALTSKHMPKDALTGLSKGDRFVGKKELHKFLREFIELAKTE